MSQHACSCLDNIVTNMRDPSFATYVCGPGLSDHLAQVMDIYFSARTLPRCTRSFEVVTDEGVGRILDALGDLPWSNFENELHSIDELAQYLVSTLKNLITFYSVTVKNSGNNVAGPVHWFNADLKKYRETLHVLETTARSSQDDLDLYIFRKFRTCYRKALREAKRAAYNNYISNSSNIAKSTWRIANYEKSATSCNKASNFSPNDFNVHFSSAAQRVVDALPSSSVGPVGLLRDVGASQASLFLFPVDQVEVLGAVRSLGSSTSPDCYGLTSKIIKGAASILAAPLVHLFNRCIREGYFPDLFKVSRVTPVFKKGSSGEIDNFRPIAIVPIFGKLLEIIIKNRLQAYFDKFSLFSSSQFGFRPGRNASQALSTLVSFITNTFDTRHHASAVLFDLQKAFDTMSHDILLGKLEHYGVRGLARDLIKSYLTNRKQFVQLNGFKSNTLPALMGVPQGSVLGPLLFVIFINDFPECIKPYSSVSYADDTTLLVSSGNRFGLPREVQCAEDSATMWFVANKLKLNPEKTQKISFTSIGSSGKTVTLLGVTLDESLRWSEHVSCLVSRLSSAVFVLRRLKPLLNTSSLLTVYYGLIHSRLAYALDVWGGSRHIFDAFRLQKRAVRVIAGLRPLDSCRGKFIEYKILTLPSQYVYVTLLNIHRHAGDYLRHSDIHSYDTRNASDLVLDRSRVCCSYNNKLNVTLYNLLPHAWKSYTLNKFKKTVKDYLAENSFYTTEEFKESICAYSS